MILISKDSREKVRVVTITKSINENNHHIIHRISGVFGGKQTNQPDIVIIRGKAKRTIDEQSELEFNSHVKKYLDKGYKVYEDLTTIPYSDITESQISELVDGSKTNQNGVIKPMLAKDYNKCPINVLEQDWYGSRKIDGVRALFSFDGHNITVSSRGGGDYNASTTHIRNDSNLIEFFKNNPDYVLDGELYKHGLSLQKISGLCRLEESSERTEQIEFWIYDFAHLNNLEMTFEDRLEVLCQIKKDYFDDVLFDIYSDSKIKFVPHKKMAGFNAIDLNHDRYIKEGFEGIVVRDLYKPYGIGKRDARMLKVKKYQDAEFEIIGYEEGLRDEDFVFTCKTSEDKEFKAKPIGTRELKEQYRNDMDKIIGKMATVKFFYYSDDNIPLQPVLKSIRNYGE